MERNATRDRYVRRSTWTTASCETLSVLTTVLALAFAASLLTASIGAPEDVVTVAIATVGVVAVGLALARLFTYLETEGLPLLE